ncbi:hypothetical protein Poli38472_003426 [Pythium oligandrum]|uniref:EF-hand domain-containing protein n=1 Tax=Pythium oligandrum TaxID=41045 RepID=A0A8K1C6I0_PYTOL|nr:hypothetical protein Poli38472_003426 [Pythium oligandrum]|eukprot:TMW57501.1 hypothetical protein Poli38472_003426 [Pythium oligandrum]
MTSVTPRATSLTQWNAVQQQSAETVDVPRLVAAIQGSLRQRGLAAWVTLGQGLERAQQDSQGAGLGRATLKRVLTGNQLQVSEVDTRALLRFLTPQDDARVSADTIKHLLCGPLTGRRLELVQGVFEQLDHQRVGYVSTQDIIAWQDASKHPSVMFGDKTASQVHDELVSSFMALLSATGASTFVNLYQWMTYFQYVSGNAPSDEFFDLILTRVWKATPKTSLRDITEPSATDERRLSGNSTTITPPLSLLQALQDAKHITVPPPAPISTSAALPQRLHRSQSLTMPSQEVVSPRAAHTTAEFLKGAQFAACLVDPTLRQPTNLSPRSKNRGSPRVSMPGVAAAATPAAPILDAGTLSVLNRLRAAIKTRGLRSLVALTRQIRLSDADGDGLLTLAEFKVALRPSSDDATPLSESDLRVLFKYLDRDHRGAIPIHVALDFIREPMNPRRLALVRAAFEALDPLGMRLLEPSDVVQRYDARRHPEVIAGRKTEEQAFQDFIEHFDLEDATQGKISLAQWEQYYHNVGFFVPDDDYFELTIRNTWQLQLQQLTTASPSGNDTGAPGHAPLEARPRIVRGHAAGHDSRQAFAILQPDLGDHHAAILAAERHGISNASPSKTTAAAAASATAYTSAQQSKEIRRIIHQLRTALKDQGVVGFSSLQRAFRLMDEDRNGSISLHEFTRALRECKLHTVTPQDAQTLFHVFDANHDGALDFTEFLLGIREPMNERRMLFVRMAFDILDKDRNGVLEVSDIVDVYDARKHPDVLSGRKTERDVFTEFLESFDIDHLHEGKVSFDEWTRYYQNISASIDDDDYFELMMRNAWHISGGKGWCANSSNRRVLVTHADGSTSVEEVENDIGVRKEDVSRVLAAQMERRGSTGMQKSSFYDVLDHSSRPTAAPTGGLGMVRTKNNSSASIAACLGGGGNANTNNERPSTPTGAPPLSRRRSSSLPNQPGNALPTQPTSAPAGVQAIISRLKIALKAKGAHGFCGLSRKFRILDDDGNGSLNLSEFRKAMRECDLELNDGDLRLLFQYFDRDRSGSIDLNEFLIGVRDPLSERRLGFVREAFKRMDKDGNGLLEPSDIVEAYDASQHPDVMSGRKTPEDVFRDFLETFDVDGIHNGKITWDQWVHYYQNVSASIDDEDYFELMMRNAWHISGGVGWCENTTARRVLVTREDGSEVVKEVKDDLGVKIQDVAARLQAQEANTASKTASIAMSSAFDLTQPPQTGTKKIVSLKDASFGAPLQLMTAGPSVSSGNLSGEIVFYSIRRRLQQKTVSDVVALRQGTIKYIDAKTSTISAGHCAEALSSTLGLTLSEAHCMALIEYMNQLPEAQHNETPGLGSVPAFSIGARLLQTQTQATRITIKRLFACLLGQLSPRCAESVRRIFSSLQAAGKGRVFPIALAKSFQAANHPDVKLGLTTADAVFQDFAANLELSGTSDGSVALEHFETYCVNLRATLGSDEYFALLLRECFVLP